MATQDRSLVYAKYLPEGVNVVVLKQPSFMKDVVCVKLAGDFYESTVSAEEQEDVYIKKIVANVNIGLLEKCYIKKSAGYLFHDYEECKY